MSGQSKAATHGGEARFGLSLAPREERRAQSELPQHRANRDGPAAQKQGRFGPWGAASASVWIIPGEKHPRAQGPNHRAIAQLQDLLRRRTAHVVSERSKIGDSVDALQ
jgi:hypothetical protein